jgi:hypothetical protein
VSSDATAVPADLRPLRRFAVLMDEQFEIPGMHGRFGLDAILGLIPGFGDFAGLVLSMWILAAAFRHHVPAARIARIVWNIALDFLVGLVPVLGDVLDVVLKANIANVDIILRYRDQSLPPRGHGAFVALLAVLLLVAFLLAAGIVFVVYAALSRFAARP